MPDHLTPEQRSRAMSRVKTKDNRIERALRSAIHRRGMRFNKHVRSLPGTPDLVFPRLKVAVFVDGDFWHGYRFRRWKHKLKPFWLDKITTNRARDSRNFRKLRELGWKVIKVWEHDIEADLDRQVSRVAAACERRKVPAPSRGSHGDA